MDRDALVELGATREQRRLYRASFEQLEHNRTLFRPGRTLREVVEAEWPIPEEFLPYRYGLAHGVGLKDEYPFLPNRADLDRLSDPDQPIQPGMVLSLESYIGDVVGREGVKLEDQKVPRFCRGSRSSPRCSPESDGPTEKFIPPIPPGFLLADGKRVRHLGSVSDFITWGLQSRICSPARRPWSQD